MRWCLANPPLGREPDRPGGLTARKLPMLIEKPLGAGRLKKRLSWCKSLSRTASR